MFKMLIVDDESTERECIRYLIQSADLPLELREAESASTALELLKTWPADILFTDIRMPASSGLDLAKRAAELLPGIKTIIFSSYAEFEYARTAMTLGAVSYILKPVVPKELEATITDVIHLLNEEQDLRLLQDTQQSYMVQYALHGCINGTLPPAQRVSPGGTAGLPFALSRKKLRRILRETPVRDAAGYGDLEPLLHTVRAVSAQRDRECAQFRL